MNRIVTLLGIAGILLVAPSIALAESGHDHAAEHAGGPKGGRLLENTKPQAEFFVEKDKTVSITFYDKSMKPVAASDQSATLTVDTNGNKSKLEFEKKGDILVTTGALTEGDSHNVVLQLKQTAEAKPTNFRFTLDGNVCGECKRAEYACICAH